MTGPQAAVLRALVAAEWCRCVPLADALNMRTSSVSAVLNNLIAAGLVTYRGTGYEATDKGRAAVASLDREASQ